MLLAKSEEPLLLKNSIYNLSLAREIIRQSQTNISNKLPIGCRDVLRWGRSRPRTPDRARQPHLRLPRNRLLGRFGGPVILADFQRVFACSRVA